MNSITVKSVKRMDKGSLKAFAEVVVNGITIRDCRVVAPEGRDRFVSMPQKKWTNKEGKDQWSPLVVLPEDLQKEVESKVLSAV